MCEKKPITNNFMKIKNEAGEEIEVFTAEEVEAKAKEAAAAAATEAIEKYKQENPAKTPEQIAAEQKAAEEKAKQDAEPINKLQADLKAVQDKLHQKEVSEMARAYAGSDKTKQDEFKAAFGKLTGFDATPEGFALQAESAAKMIGIDVRNVNVGDVAATGGGRNIDAPGTKPATEVDKGVQKALGISKEDAEKYGPKAAEELAKIQGGGQQQ